MKTDNHCQTSTGAVSDKQAASVSESIHTFRRHAIIRFAVILSVIGLAFIAAGYRYYRHTADAIRTDRSNALRFIADGKAQNIANWRMERLTNARILASGLVRTDALQWIKLPENKVLKTELLDRFRLFQESYRLQNVMLVAPDGRLLLSLEPDGMVIEPRAKALILQAVETDTPVFGNFYACERMSSIHLDVAAPIRDEEGNPAAVVLLRTDPNACLYPLIQSWPTPSKTAETLLFCRDGDEVLFLNKLRHLPDPPLTLRIPMTQTDVPAVHAAMGMKGVFEGFDYRGEPVLTDLRPIAGSPWYMVAKVDSREILAEVRYRARGILLFVVLGLILLGILSAFLLNEQRRHLYKSLYRTEREKRKAQEEIRATLYGIGDGVIATDATGRVTRMNPVAEKLTGWSEAEALTRPIKEVFCIVNEDTRSEVESPVERVLREGKIVGLANHTALIARDGAERAIADSGSPIYDEEGQLVGVVLVFRDQTTERAAEETITASRNLLESIVENAPIRVFWKDRDLRFLGCNTVFARDAGFSTPEELIGKDDRQMSWCKQAELYRADDKRVMDSGVPILNYDEPQTTPDGNTIWLRTSKVPLHNQDGRVIGLLGIYDDITECKRVEDELLKNQQRYQKAQALGLVGNWEYDPVTSLFWGSDGVKRIYGFDLKRKAFTTEFVESCILERERVHRALTDLIEEDKEYDLEFDILTHAKGIRKTIRSIAEVERDAQGNPVKITGVIHDITKDKQAEKERAAIQTQLVQSQKLESIGTLAGGVAHEINNPIMGIMNYAQLILDNIEKKNPSREYASEIMVETKRVATIVKNLLGFARQDKQGHSPANMDDIVRTTLSLVQTILRHDQILLTVDVPENLPSIQCRSQQIQQVLMNLVTNARDALNNRYPTHNKDKTIRIMAQKFEKAGCPFVRTTVEDHGMGISPESRERIFDPFYTTKPRNKGTGLGLAISHSIVKEHGGELSVESEPGQWTRFHVDLPVESGVGKAENGKAERLKVEMGNGKWVDER